MRQERNTVRFTLDAYTRVCLTLIAVLLTVMILGLWADHAPNASSARAAEPFLNSAGQRNEMIKAQQDAVRKMDETLRKMDELMKLLESGRVKVQLAEPQGSAGGTRNVPPTPPTK